MMSRYEEAFAKAKVAAGEPVVHVHKNWLLAWVMDDCTNKNCIDGNVSYDNGKNCRLYRCPLCSRSMVPSAALDKGPLEEWTPEEMGKRLKDRKDVYYDSDYRYRRGKEIMGLLLEISGAGRVKVQEPVDAGGPF